jgi:flagellar hook-associated protein 3 FlgL
MKVSFVSSQAINQALRYQTQRMQADLIQANKEVVSLRVADVGMALGARSGVSLSMHREIERLQGLIDSNELAASRLSSTQVGLQELTAQSEKLMAAVSTALSGAADTALAREEAAAVLSTMSSVLNSNLNGEHLFAGINTDVKPFSDFTDPTSASRVAFEAEFAAYFTFPPDDAQAGNISAADMEDFMTNVVEPMFFGAGWTDWSTATDQQITTRITLSETAQTSVSANVSGVRKLAMAGAMMAGMFYTEMNVDARQALLERSSQLIGEAQTDLANEQGLTGITEQRISNASQRMSMQIDIFTGSINDLEGIDWEEASTRVTGLMAQIELSYTLTSRMQQLSLLKYL